MSEAVPRTGSGSIPCGRVRDVVMSRRGFQVRPLGGGAGCLTMIALSIIASVVLTVLLNLLARL